MSLLEQMKIAQPRPDMNIKVTALTVTQKLYYTYNILLFSYYFIDLISTLNPLFFFVLKMMSAFKVSCIYSNVLQTRLLVECHGSVDRTLDWVSNGCWFKTHHRWSHFNFCLVLIQLRKTGNWPDITEKLLTGA